MTQQWRATIDWPRPATATRTRQAALARALPGFGVVADLGDGRLTAQMTVTAGTLRRAVDAALRAASDAYTGVFGQPGNPAAVRVLTVDAFDAELATPAGQDLVGLTEIGQMLGVSKQRAGQLAERPDFPAPVARLAQGPVYTRMSIQAFERGWDRTPGRPRKPTSG